MSEKKVVVITGAAQGIGLAGVKKFLKEGWAVAATDIKKKELDEEVAKLVAEGHDVTAYELDVTNYKQGQEVIAEVVKKYGRIDALFNDAGITGHRKNILNFDPELIKQAEDVNLWGSLYLIQHVSRVFVEKKIKGAIVNVSSFVASFAEWSPFGYGISKSSVDGLTRTAAFHLGEYGIRVNSVAPGYTKTEMAIKYDYSDPKLRKAAEDKSLLNRWIEPSEIAAAAYFLASDEASAITGVKLPVDAGYTTTKEDNKVSLYGETE
ncbi:MULTISPECIES: SDR family NAD(P)-dependent oxidoreductase [unclassified Fibrobacter]|uniref:SDR family NAD(P)-dependent oxidoreductase n=1 Tax=unclassified Fibrobacter TaxID=2634177 RepID=UPI000D6B24AC|nr:MULTISPECIES: SDR family oxidoreductase [unclassified Fibrobacter]PWJ56884.1 3-oxoacyl-[acyl-carrier protein] reductase [Fibrobacter sp. UWR4]PZW62717.1 3-oxoacyl-[acyl-carrier protein] reductase [Fibrobacter sp. UWR1]